MKVYNVLLEGLEGDKGFFITFQLVSDNKDKARFLALEKAKELLLQIVKVEDIEEYLSITDSKDEGVVNISGKSFF